MLVGLIVLIVVGGVLGWLAAIVVRREDHQGILLNVAFGVAGALIAGLLSNSEPILYGLSARSLLISLTGALFLLALFNAFRGGHPG